jgi:hypothetical protein
MACSLSWLVSATARGAPQVDPIEADIPLARVELDQPIRPIAEGRQTSLTR